MARKKKITASPQTHGVLKALETAGHHLMGYDDRENCRAADFVDWARMAVEAANGMPTSYPGIDRPTPGDIIIEILLRKAAYGDVIHAGASHTAWVNLSEKLNKWFNEIHEKWCDSSVAEWSPPVDDLPSPEQEMLADMKLTPGERRMADEALAEAVKEYNEKKQNQANKKMVKRIRKV